ncbi:MAG: PrsW family intramembrane metalloprotease [Rhodoglobus sp.]
MSEPARTILRRRESGFLVVGIVGFVAVTIVMLFVVAYVISGIGANAFILGAVLAVVPLVVVFTTARWIDRWEPEPRLAVIFSFLWGAGVAVLISIVVESEIGNLISSLGGPPMDPDIFFTMVQAPVVEELGKALGIVLMFWVARRHFDGPIDGLVYAAWIAGGFAFTENIVYFGSELASGDSDVAKIWPTFVARGLMSPFAHIIFTGCTGIAIGFAVRARRFSTGFGIFAAGLALAIALHAVWNSSAYFIGDLISHYIIIQLPLFVLAIVVVFALRRREERLTFDRLTEYATRGWFNRDEVVALATRRGRRHALAWATREHKKAAMNTYIQDATRLAFVRQRILIGHDTVSAAADEVELLSAIAEDRTALGDDENSQDFTR